MFGWVRLGVMGFIVLTLVYIVLSIWSRQVRKGKLRREWVEEEMTGDMEVFVDQGLKEYDGSIRRKLILGVYVVPTVLVGVIIYLTNFT